MAFNCITILGPTASGKTKLAAMLAYFLDGEIISADSRQVYKNLNIGTGKDLEEYLIQGKQVPFHLIDVSEPAEQYYLHHFITDLKKKFEEVCARNKVPIICGGSGMYLDALRKDFSFTQVEENEELRKELKNLDRNQLLGKLKSFPAELINHVDLKSEKRIIGGIEIASHRTQKNLVPENVQLPYHPYYLGIMTSPEKRREKIKKRLKLRMQQGLVKEVQNLLGNGITHDRLQFLGLEYKFVSLFLQNKITEQEMLMQLETAINQFAKRQMTWFRKMEKEGVNIHWIDPDTNVQKLAREIKIKLEKKISS